MTWMLSMLIWVTLAGCGSTPEPHRLTLAPPTGVNPQAATLVTEGNRLFETKTWDRAKAEYEAALKILPTLAEAHYNLALTLERLGDPAGAKSHYLEAATLAPGNKTIWNAPPLRKHTVVDPVMEKNKNWLDADPKYK